MTGMYYLSVYTVHGMTSPYMSLKQPLTSIKHILRLIAILTQTPVVNSFCTFTTDKYKPSIGFNSMYTFVKST